MNPFTSKTLGQRGFTMVELMVALAISLLLLAGVLQIFLGSKQTYRVQDNLSRVQENGRFALDYLGRNIRLAGYRFDLSRTPAQKFSTVARRTVVGTDDDGTNGSDTLTVRFEGDREDIDGDGVLDAGEPGDVDGDGSLNRGSIIDCLGTSINAGKGDSSPLATNILSISNTNNLVCNNGTTSQPIVEGVENMQILYGVPNDNNIGYVPAGSVTADMWPEVFSVRISLLLQTLEDNLADAPQPYNYNGATVTPNDRRLRRVFTTTITLRNRVL